MAILKKGTTVDGSLVHTHKTLPITILNDRLSHGSALVFDTKYRPSYKDLTDNVIDVRTDSVIINTSKGNTTATLYDTGNLELKKNHVPYFSVEPTGNIIGRIEWSRVNSKPIVGTTGTSTTNIMHQKAVTDLTDSVGYASGKMMREGAYGLGSIGAPRFSEETDTNLDTTRKAGLYSVQSGVTNAPEGNNSGDSMIEWGWGGTFRSQMFITNRDGFLHTRGQQNGKWREWNTLATVDQLNKINDGIKNRLIKDSGKLITTGSAETLLDKVDLGDYNQYMFTNNQYLGLESPTNFYIETREADDDSVIQVGYPIMTQRASDRKVNNRLIIRNRHPWRDATNAIKRHDWSDWSLTLVNQDLVKVINSSVANASDEKIPTEKAVRTELNKMIVGGSVVQSLSTSTTDIPSVKLVNDEFKKVNDDLTTVIDTTITEIKKDIDKKWDIQDTIGTGNITRISLVNLKVNKTDIVDILGTSKDKVASQFLINTVNNSLTTEIDKKITGGSLVAVKGTSAINVMHQKAVTDELNKRALTTTMNTELGKKQDNLTFTGTGNVARMSEVDKKRDINNNQFDVSLTVNSGNGHVGKLGVNTSSTTFIEVAPSGKSPAYANFQHKTGTVALTSDIPALGGYATQSWVNSNSTKLGNELSVIAGSAGNVWADRAILAMAKVPANSVITRIGEVGDGFRAYYRPIIRL